jgi:hypothetical protein
MPDCDGGTEEAYNVIISKTGSCKGKTPYLTVNGCSLAHIPCKLMTRATPLQTLPAPFAEYGCMSLQRSVQKGRRDSGQQERKPGDWHLYDCRERVI